MATGKNEYLWHKACLAAMANNQPKNGKSGSMQPRSTMRCCGEEGQIENKKGVGPHDQANPHTIIPSQIYGFLIK